MSAISAARVSASSSPTPGIVTSSATSAVGARDRRELLLERSDPLVEQFDDSEGLLDRALPDRGHVASGEQLEPILAAQPLGAQSAAPTACPSP